MLEWLDLENARCLSGYDVFVVCVFDGTAGLANARNWSFTMNGETPQNLCLATLNGRLTLCTKGTMLILR